MREAKFYSDLNFSFNSLYWSRTRSHTIFMLEFRINLTITIQPTLRSSNRYVESDISKNKESLRDKWTGSNISVLKCCFRNISIGIQKLVTIHKFSIFFSFFLFNIFLLLYYIHPIIMYEYITNLINFSQNHTSLCLNDIWNENVSS